MSISILIRPWLSSAGRTHKFIFGANKCLKAPMGRAFPTIAKNAAPLGLYESVYNMLPKCRLPRLSHASALLSRGAKNLLICNNRVEWLVTIRVASSL